MSIPAINWAFDLPCQSAAQKLLLLALADNANDRDEAWPALDHICRKTGLARSTVIEQIHILAENGVLVVEHQRRGGRCAVNRYHLAIPAAYHDKHRATLAQTGVRPPDHKGSAHRTTRGDRGPPTGPSNGPPSGLLGSPPTGPKPSPKRTTIEEEPPFKLEADPVGSPPPPRSQRASRLPSDFQVPLEWKDDGYNARSKAKLPEVDLNVEADKFVNYWVARSGAGATKTDWRRTWINWSLSARGGSSNGSGYYANGNSAGGARPSRADTIVAAALAAGAAVRAHYGDDPTGEGRRNRALRAAGLDPASYRQ